MIELFTCPFAGIICVQCQQPVPNGDDKFTFTRQIGKHETTKHNVHSDIAERDAFVQQYENKMKDMSRAVKDIMVFDEELAKKTYFDFVGDVTEYYFCSHHDCNKLVLTILEGN